MKRFYKNSYILFYFIYLDINFYILLIYDT